MVFKRLIKVTLCPQAWTFATQMTNLTLNNPVFIYLWWDQEFHTKLPPLRLAGAQENIESSLVLWHTGRFRKILSKNYHLNNWNRIQYARKSHFDWKGVFSKPFGEYVCCTIFLFIELEALNFVYFLIFAKPCKVWAWLDKLDIWHTDSNFA